MLFRSEPLDKEELNGGVVYVLTIPRTRKVTVCDSNTLREKRAGGVVMKVCVCSPMIFQLVKTSLTDCCTALPSFQHTC